MSSQKAERKEGKEGEKGKKFTNTKKIGKCKYFNILIGKIF